MLDTSKLTEVVRFLLESDDSFYENPERLIYGFKDLYTGNQSIYEDFVASISALSSIDDSVSVTVINNLISRQSKYAVFAPILKCIFVNGNCLNIWRYEQSIQDAYNTSKIKHNRRNRNNSCDSGTKSSIKYFRSNQEKEVLFGDIITFEWMCVNPIVVLLQAGGQRMEVSGLTSLCLKALFDCYDLILQDLKGNILASQKVYIDYRKVTYCINCGQIIYDYTDTYCTECGMRI